MRVLGVNLGRGGTAPGAALATLRRALAAVRPSAQSLATVLDRLDADAAATAFHAEQSTKNDLGRPPLVVLLGGTGTGKSTLVNRLCDAPDHGEGAVTATSFRRTFTAGAVAVARSRGDVPAAWLSVPHVAADRPARGVAEQLVVVEHDGGVTSQVTLIDTPDLDGDTPLHHEQADRAFRWAEAVLFVTTPEKYQMTELLAYYRLAGRYGTPAVYVMNKADDLLAADDWASQLSETDADAATFVVPRDDAGLTPPPDRSLDALRSAVSSLTVSAEARAAGVRARLGDLAGRVQDQVLSPLRQRRAAADAVKTRMAALVRPEPGVDVGPMTRSLQRRLQQQSVLYLMGPGRVIDRVRSVPSLVARLPRSTWNLVTRGRTDVADPTDDATTPAAAPDFRSELMDALLLVQSRLGDALNEAGFEGDDWRLNTTDAGDIATSELDDLRRWLEERWNARPRDTRAIQAFVGKLPGGRHLHKVSEAAPYLLVAASAATNVVMGPVDQIVIGGYLLTTWLGERLSNEVAAKTRETNRRIGRRFDDLCERQVEQAVAFVESRAATARQIDAISSALEDLEPLR